MSVNTGHRARIPVYFGTDVRELGYWSTGSCHRMHDSGFSVSRIYTRGTANARTRPQAERRQVSGLPPRDGKGGGISPAGVWDDNH